MHERNIRFVLFASLFVTPKVQALISVLGQFQRPLFPGFAFQKQKGLL